MLQHFIYFQHYPTNNDMKVRKEYATVLQTVHENMLEIHVLEKKKIRLQ